MTLLKGQRLCTPTGQCLHLRWCSWDISSGTSGSSFHMYGPDCLLCKMGITTCFVRRHGWKSNGQIFAQQSLVRLAYSFSLSCIRKLITGSSTARWERIAHSPPATGVQISEVLSFLIYKGEVGTGVLWACCSFRNLELQVHNLQFFLTFYLLGFSSYLLFLPQVDCNYFLSLVLFKKIAKIPYGLVIDYDSYFRLFLNLRLMNLYFFLITKS